MKASDKAKKRRRRSESAGSEVKSARGGAPEERSSEKGEAQEVEAVQSCSPRRRAGYGWSHSSTRATQSEWCRCDEGDQGFRGVSVWSSSAPLADPRHRCHASWALLKRFHSPGGPKTSPAGASSWQRTHVAMRPCSRTWDDASITAYSHAIAVESRGSAPTRLSIANRTTPSGS